jgi:hypothetical protein
VLSYFLAPFVDSAKLPLGIVVLGVMSKTQLEQMNQETWISGPLPMASAIRIWAAAAGTAGAYFPRHFAQLTREVCSPNVGLTRLVDEAVARSNWQHDGYLGPEGFPPPRRPELNENTLVWQTSVCTTLRRATEEDFNLARMDVVKASLGNHPDVEEWSVTIEGYHPERMAAAEAALIQEIESWQKQQHETQERLARLALLPKAEG